MANTWILIRHPDKEGDKEGIYGGNAAKITSEGQMQITEVLDRLMHWHEQPTLVLSSTIPRARELALNIARDLDLQMEIHPFFDEIDKPQSLVGLRRDSPEHENVMRAIRSGFDRNKVPFGVQVKCRTELEDQTRETFDYIEKLPHDVVLNIGHAKRIASHVHWVWKNCTTLKGYYTETDRNLKIDTTGITVLKRMPDRRTGQWHWHVETLNDTSHSGMPATANPAFSGLLDAFDRKD